MSRCLTCGRYSATWPSCANCGPYHLSIPSWAVPKLSEFAADDGSIDEAGALQWLRENELAAWPESFVQAPCRVRLSNGNQVAPSKEDRTERIKYVYGPPEWRPEEGRMVPSWVLAPAMDNLTAGACPTCGRNCHCDACLMTNKP